MQVSQKTLVMMHCLITVMSGGRYSDEAGPVTDPEEEDTE